MSININYKLHPIINLLYYVSLLQSTLATRWSNIANLSQNRLVEAVCSLRNVQSWVALEKVEWHKVDVVDFNWHHWEILSSWNMGEAQGGPHNNILVSHWILSLDPFAHTGVGLRLVSELTSCEQLVVLVLGDPKLLGSKLCSLDIVRVLVSQNHLSSRHHHLVTNITLCSWVDDVLIDNLVRSVGKWRLLNRTRLVQVSSLGNKSNTVRVELVTWHFNHIIIAHCVLVTVNSWVDTEGQDVLVVCGHDVRTHNGSPWHCDILVNWHGGQDTSSSDLNVNGTIVDEFQVDSIFVVGHSGNSLNNKFTLSGNHGILCSVVDVLVQDSRILFMQTNGRWQDLWLTSSVGGSSVQVLDHTKTVTAETQLVSVDTKATVTQVESLLSVVWSSWVTIWHSHLRQGDTVKHLSALEPTIVHSKTFSDRWSHAELPTLPGNLVARHVERWAFWLLDQQWLWVSEHGFTVQVWVVLDTWNNMPWAGRSGGLVKSTWQEVNSNKLLGVLFKHRRELQWQRVVVRLGVAIVGQHVHEKLHQWSLFVWIVSRIDPWVVSDSVALWQFQLFNLSLDCWVGKTVVFPLLNIFRQEWAHHAVRQAGLGDDVAHCDIDKSLVELQCVGVVVHVQHSRDQGKWSTVSLSLQVLDHVLLWWVQSIHLDKVNVVRSSMGVFDQLGSDLDLVIVNAVKGVNRWRHLCKIEVSALDLKNYFH